MNGFAKLPGKFALSIGVTFFLTLPLGTAQARALEVLYSFTKNDRGAHPYGTPFLDSHGDLYGTTETGGADGYGAVFRLSRHGVEKPVHTFAGKNDGAFPVAGVIADASGNLYGTTISGGANDYGTAFEISAGGAETVLHSFGGGSDGAQPVGGVILDGAGNLYGTTSAGGNGGQLCNSGCGTVFEISSGGSETVLYAFAGGSDGAEPVAGLLMDSSGNLYGTTSGRRYDYGTVFELAPDGSLTVLHSFAGGSDGALPYAGVIADKAGNLYGTTWEGGSSNRGTVFKISTDGTETILHAFMDGSDGAGPAAGLVIDGSGNLYGTTQYGGTPNLGTIFRISPNGRETVLRAFAYRDGISPYGGLFAYSGALYGTAVFDGAGQFGTVFKVSE
jgi:uncharacterized repeat protein (TIGR03803 family)